MSHVTIVIESSMADNQDIAEQPTSSKKKRSTPAKWRRNIIKTEKTKGM
jgi:hypothetical protein